MSTSAIDIPVIDELVIHQQSVSDIRKLEDIIGIERRNLSLVRQGDKLDVTITGFVTDNFQLISVNTPCELIERFSNTESLLAFIPTQGWFECQSHFLQAQAHKQQAIILSPGKDLRFRWGPASNVLVLHLRLPLLNTFVEELPNGLGERLLEFHHRLDLDDEQYHKALSLLQSFSLEIKNNLVLMREDTMLNAWLRIIMAALAQSHPDATDNSSSGTSFELCPYYVKRAVNYIHDNLMLDLSRDDIVAASGTNQRSLHKGFKKVYGVGPIGYFKRIRLEYARDELLAKTPKQTSVNQVARNWGFYDPSRFAANYRKQFGELPSLTLHHENN